jgi:DNA-binding NarL/FixJ family response regulator
VAAFPAGIAEIRIRRLPISVVVVDDNRAFRQGLKSFLEGEGLVLLGEGSDGLEAIRLIEKYHPDIAILDFSMPKLNGVAAAQESLRAFPHSKVIILSLHQEEQYAIAAMNAGVKGYVLKWEAVTSLVQAIQEVDKGNTYVSPSIFACRRLP